MQLRRLFSSKPSVIQTREGAHDVPVRSRHPHWIVGRGLCLYRCESFGNVPRSRRRSALELKLPVWSPFVRTGHHCVWSGDSAMVWFWDRDKVAVARGARGGRLRGAAARAAAQVRVLPETVFGERRPGGVYLQPCREGYEIQHWSASLLVDSLWFPQRPRARQVEGFLARQEGDARMLRPESVVEVPRAEGAREPWSTSLSPREWIEVNERALVATCLIALSLALAWQEIRFWKVRGLERDVATELARMEDRLAPLLAARIEFLRSRRTNQALAELLREPSQARLMILVDRALPSAEAEFREWRYQQRALTFVIEDPDPDPIAYVRALEAEPLFDQVRAEPVRGGESRLEISLRVRG